MANQRVNSPKRGRERLPLAGGAFPGVGVTDPAGRLSIVPFTSSGDVLRGDGTMGPVSAGAVTWGNIGGTLSNQTDLQAALDAKQSLLVWDEELGNYLIAR